MIHHAALFCHAPIVIPAIAGERFSQVRKTTEAMAEAATLLVASRPECVVVLSPHTPRLRDSFGVVGGKEIGGDFGDFGFSPIRLSFPNSVSFRVRLTEAAGLTLLPAMRLDHGALVPLCFLKEAGWGGETLVISFPHSPSALQCQRLGRDLVSVAMESGKRIAILASGDMSHRLLPGAPGGFHPRAHEFDDFLVKAVSVGRFEEALRVPPALRELAGEDVIDSLGIACAATSFSSCGFRFHSYEGPFGVGYLVATLYSEAA